MTDKKQVVMYTDGACKGNPGVGGWGVSLQYGRHRKELFGGEAETTNNRMELTAAIEGLKQLKQACKVTIYTDSKYVMQGMEEWLAGWKARGWKTASKSPEKRGFVAAIGRIGGQTRGDMAVGERPCRSSAK